LTIVIIRSLTRKRASTSVAWHFSLFLFSFSANEIAQSYQNVIILDFLFFKLNLDEMKKKPQ
jgi:hypothetical protein